MKSAIFWLLFSVASAYQGIATFNDYRQQPSTVCHGNSHAYLDQYPSGVYAGAIGDLSNDIWDGSKCDGSIDTSKCNGQQPVSGYVGPACPHTNCLRCFEVCNEGGWDGASVSGVGRCVKVQIVDACPSESAFNYCKTDISSSQRCGSNVNALDIDLPAYVALTGHSKGSGDPNLKIGISTSSGC